MNKTIKDYLPSKQFIISIGVLFGIIVVFFGIKYITQWTKKNTDPSQVVIQNLINPAEVDTDGDGLYDWEEALWGTDPRNPDSNADGVSDFAEISRKKQELSIVNSESTESEGSLVPTESDQVARDVYSYIAIAQQSGASEEEIQTNVITFLLDKAEIPNAYTRNNLTIGGSTAQAINSYAQKIQQYTNSQTNVIAAIEKAVGQINNEAIDPKYFTTTGTMFIQSAQDIAGIGGIPSGIANDVLGFVNNLHRMGVIMVSIGKQDSDPILAGMYGLQFRNVLVEFNSSLENIGAYFSAATNTLQ